MKFKLYAPYYQLGINIVCGFIFVPVPSSFLIWFVLCLQAIGHIYSQLGEIDKAVETFRKATRIDPKDSGVHDFVYYLSLSF